MNMKYALITNTERSPIDTVQRYLPWNYHAIMTDGGIVIKGEDNAGWTMTDYVIPRLASGLHTAKQITEEEARALLATA